MLAKRFQLSEQWSKYCLTPIKQTGDVVPLHA
jgi:hypothetical protein